MCTEMRFLFRHCGHAGDETWIEPCERIKRSNVGRLCPDGLRGKANIVKDRCHHSKCCSVEKDVKAAFTKGFANGIHASNEEINWTKTQKHKVCIFDADGKAL